MKTLTLSSILIFFSLSVFSHEGHDQAPGSLKSRHGGVVQGGKQINLETVVVKEDVTIYPLTHEGQDLPATAVKIEAIAKPKKGKPFPVSFSPKKVGQTAKVPLNGANRLPIDIMVTNEGKTDSFKIQIEE